MSQPVPQFGPHLASAQNGSRRIVMVTSPGSEPTLSDVVFNLATVCADVGQSVVIVGTEGLAASAEGSELPLSTSLTWKNWLSPGIGVSGDDARSRLLDGPLSPADVVDLLGEAGIPGVSRLDMRYFVSNSAQVVIRAPVVLLALQGLADVVILEVPSYLSVHYGEGLTPLADAVLVVGERQTTKLKEVRGTSAALRRLRAPVVGIALTRVQGRAYDWGHESEFDPDGEQVDDERDPTEQVPITEPDTVIPAGTLDSGSPADDEPLADHASREA